MNQSPYIKKDLSGKNLDLTILHFANPKISFNAMVSPGKSLLFNSSMAMMDPFTRCDLIACKQFLVGSYNCKSKYAKEIIVSGLFFKYFGIIAPASPLTNSVFLMCASEFSAS